jgi:hypothetical protein
MASSLLKYSDRNKASGKNLFWNRVATGADEIPYRGARAPLYREEEFEAKTIRVADARNAFFDVHDPAQNQSYLDIIECCFNGWFRLVHLERFWHNTAGQRTTLHYVEWVEFYLEDGSRTPYAVAGSMELPGG